MKALHNVMNECNDIYEYISIKNNENDEKLNFEKSTSKSYKQ